MLAIVIVALIFLLWVIIKVSRKKEYEKLERECKQKQREAQEKKEHEKRERERIAHKKWQDTLYTLALKIGKESGINHLHHITLGFRMRRIDVLSEEWALSFATERAMKELTPDPNYSTTPPPIPQQIPQPFDYETPWWKEYSEWYRNEKRWTCEECELDLNYDRYYLHTHHIHGTQYNNPEHLKALCLGCHAEQLTPLGHHRLKEYSNYAEFIAKYGEQWKETLNAFKALSLQFEIELAKTSINQGVAKAELGQHNEATKDCDAAVRLNPNDAIAYRNRGWSKVRLGQYNEAVKDYDTAVRLNPNDAIAYRNRGWSKARLGQYNEAVKDYDTAVRLNPDYALAYRMRGMAKARLGQYNEAVKDYDTVVRLNSDDALAYRMRGLAKARLSQYNEAVKDYDTVVRLNSDDALAYRMRGLAKARLSQYNEAVKDYNTAVRLNPDDALAYYNRALAMKELFQQDFLAALRLATQTRNVELKNKIEEALRLLE